MASVQEWYDPSNWQDITLPASSDIILHTNNVPCVHDTVIFPQVKNLVLDLIPVPACEYYFSVLSNPIFTNTVIQSLPIISGHFVKFKTRYTSKLLKILSELFIFLLSGFYSRHLQTFFCLGV